MVIVGGGPIGAEMGQSFQRLGSQVTFVLRGGTFLGKEDPDAGNVVREVLESEGVKFVFNSDISEIEPEGPTDNSMNTKCRVVVRNQSGEIIRLDCDALVLAMGRVPNVETCDLQKAGVAYNKDKGVVINDYMQTTNPNVYAVGDCCTNQQFTHMADAMARAVVKNACFFGKEKFSKLIVPRVTYTEPEVAQVGMNKQELKAAKKEFDEYVEYFSIFLS